MTRQQAKDIALAVLHSPQIGELLHDALSFARVVRERIEDCAIGELVRYDALSFARGPKAFVPVRPSLTYDFGKFGEVTFTTTVQTFEFERVTYGVFDRNSRHTIERQYWKRIA